MTEKQYNTFEKFLMGITVTVLLSGVALLLLGVYVLADLVL